MDSQSCSGGVKVIVGIVLAGAGDSIKGTFVMESLCWLCPWPQCEYFWSVSGISCSDAHEFPLMVVVYHDNVFEDGFLFVICVMAVPALIFCNCLCMSTVLVSS